MIVHLTESVLASHLVKIEHSVLLLNNAKMDKNEWMNEYVYSQTTAATTVQM